MKKVKLFIEGFIIGLGKIIPGVSGSVMAICFGLYERLITAVSGIAKFKKETKFLFFVGTGIFLGIILGSGAIKFFLENHYIKTMMFFIGMMIPGIVPVLKAIDGQEVSFKKVAICLLVFSSLFILSIMNFETNRVLDQSYFHEFISLVLCGILDAASTIIPGISGSALLMIVGYYENIITALANILSFKDAIYTIMTLIPFSIGMGLGIVITSKIISYAFFHHRTLTYMLIMTFAAFSILTLLGTVIDFASGSVSELLFGLFYLFFGMITASTLEKVFKA